MPAGHEPPPYEVLAALVVSLRGELADALAELGRAGQRIAELEARLRQSPRNSSRPPSGEGPGKPAPKSLRRRTGRRPGGQDGHAGSTLARVAKPDRKVRHEPAGAGPGWPAGRSPESSGGRYSTCRRASSATPAGSPPSGTGFGVI